MWQGISRRRFVATAAGFGATCLAPSLAWSQQAAAGSPRILKSLKWGMIQVPGSVADRFAAAKAAGFAGVELDSPGGPPVAEVRAAIKEVGIPVEGSVDSTHWKIRLTDPDAAVRQQALADLQTALQDTHAWGGSSVLLVPGHGNDGTREEVWDRATQQIRQAIPMAARVGVFILIENVWNHMFYDHDGSNSQTAEELARFIDQFSSPWVGVQFDIGNHQKYGKPAEWIRTLGPRIVKLDVKDWGVENGFCKIGDGDVDWDAVRAALDEIGFCGWAAAEVAGGDADRLRDIASRMDRL